MLYPRVTKLLHPSGKIGEMDEIVLPGACVIEYAVGLSCNAPVELNARALFSGA